MKSPIQIVNDDDQIIGHKERTKVDYQKEIYRVAALWLTNSKGEILIAQRTKIKDRDPGKWGPSVAGTVDEGETYDINIYKEAEEEIGLTGVKFTKGPKKRVRHPRNYFCQWYTGKIDRDEEEFVLQEDEVDAVKWISPQDLLEDYESNPSKYIPAMEMLVDMFVR